MIVNAAHYLPMLDRKHRVHGVYATRITIDCDDAPVTFTRDA